jgi:hypothetical protein
MATVTIKNGTCKGQTIKNQTFHLIQGFKVEHGVGFVTVDGTSLTGRTAARVKVGRNDFVVNGEVSGKRGRKPNAVNAVNAIQVADREVEIEPEVESTETDEEILARISKRFDILNKMTIGARNGDIRALFVVGAPGVGKTYGVEKTLNEAGMIEVFSGETKKFQIISGAASPVGLYMKLYEFRDDNNVLVFDDCDSIFTDELMLNLMKAALDTSAKRMIHWNVDSVSLRRGDVPNSFEFKGSVIFISNVNFRKIRSERMRGHITALASRSHFLDLTISTEREKLLRIEDLVTNKGMLKQFKLTDDTSKKVMKFIREHAAEFNELSLRTVIKLAGLARTFEDNDEWMDVARMSLMGNMI